MLALQVRKLGRVSSELVINAFVYVGFYRVLRWRRVFLDVRSSLVLSIGRCYPLAIFLSSILSSIHVFVDLLLNRLPSVLASHQSSELNNSSFSIDNDLRFARRSIERKIKKLMFKIKGRVSSYKTIKFDDVFCTETKASRQINTPHYTFPARIFHFVNILWARGKGKIHLLIFHSIFEISSKINDSYFWSFPPTYPSSVDGRMCCIENGLKSVYFHFFLFFTLRRINIRTGLLFSLRLIFFFPSGGVRRTKYTIKFVRIRIFYSFARVVHSPTKKTKRKNRRIFAQ